MGKYANLESDIYSIFATAEWQAELIKTYPQNYTAVSPGDEFIRISIIPSGKGLNINSVAGVLMIDIFTPFGKGTKGKYININSGKSTQFQSSSLGSMGIDEANQSLYRAIYSIPFNYFGVQ
jgi:hypothetical protein